MIQSLRYWKSSKDLFLYAGLLFFLLLATIGIIVPYISSQHAFIGGDINDGFYGRAIETTDLFRSSPLDAIQNVFQDANKTYNSFYTLPLIPFLLVLGDSYLAFVVSLAIVYIIPLNLVLGTIATQLIPGRPQAVFASTVIIATLFTPNWITVLIGHPDIGATLIISLGIWVAIQGLKQQFTWLLPYRWQVPVLGALLGIAILFRRHYAYANVAVLAAIVVQTLIVFFQELRNHKKAAFRHLFGFAIRLGLVLATSLVVLAIVAPEFARRALTTDYVSLYDSWSRTIGETIQFYSSLYGWGTWLIVFLGYLIGLQTQTLSRPIATFILLFGNSSLAIWLFKLRYTETYYAIHFVPFVILGIAAFFWAIGLQFTRYKRQLILSLAGGYLLINAIVCLTPMGAFQNPLRSVFAANYPPPVRQNYDNIVQLTNVLRELAPNGESIFVVHTGPLTDFLIESAEQTVYGTDGKILNVNGGSAIDSVGYYSIRELLEAQYVVVAQPFLSWHEGQQDTAKVVFDAFTQGWEITQDFEQLPQQFDLKNGATASIYQRIQPTSIDRAVRTLYAMQMQVNKPLAKQLDWVMLTPPFDSSIRKGNNQQHTVKIKSGESSQLQAAQSPITALLYLGQLTDSIQVSGRAVLKHSQCSAANLAFSTLNAQGATVHSTEAVQVFETSNFQVSMPASDALYVLLEVSNRSPQSEASRCPLDIKHLVVQ